MIFFQQRFDFYVADASRINGAAVGFMGATKKFKCLTRSLILY